MIRLWELTALAVGDGKRELNDRCEKRKGDNRNRAEPEGRDDEEQGDSRKDGEQWPRRGEKNWRGTGVVVETGTGEREKGERLPSTMYDICTLHQQPTRPWLGIRCQTGGEK